MLHNSQKHSFLNTALFAGIIFFVAFAFFAIPFEQSYAVEDTDLKPVIPQDHLLSPAGMLATFAAGLGLEIVNAFLYVGFIFTGWIADLAGTFAQFAIETGVDKLSDVSIVQDGWNLSRDLANLFFIFILLVIAIATILRRESYGMKALLPTLIIMALFINFSLMLTQFVIQPSNYLGLYFLNRIEQDNDAGFHAAVKKALYLSSVLNVSTIPNEKAPTKGTFGSILRTAADLVTLPTTIGIGIWDRITGADLEQKGLVSLYAIAAIIFFLVIAFVLFAITILVTIRTVVLMALMIFAPLAFLLHALPATSAYAQRWWSMLFKQSLFLPAMLFMVWLGIRLSNKLKEGLTPDQSILDSAGYLYSFVLVILFLVLSLYVAKELSAWGANIAISYGGRARRYATGAVGGISTYYTTRLAAQKISESKFAREKAGERPLYGAIQKRLEEYAKPRKEVEERQARYQQKYMQSLPADERAQYFAQASQEFKKQYLKDTSTRNIAEMVKRAKTDEAKEGAEKVIAKLGESDHEKYVKYLEERAALETQNLTKNIETLANEFTAFNADLQRTVGERMAKYATPTERSVILATPGDLRDAYLTHFKELGATVEDVAGSLENLGQRATARKLREDKTVQTLHGFPGGEETEKKEKLVLVDYAEARELKRYNEKGEPEP